MDTEIFRQTLSQFATGVTIVMSKNRDTLRGMTVNSFTSVSLVPPLILFCTDNTAEMLPAIQHSQRFTVSILRQEQESLSNQFALLGPQDKLFQQVALRPGIAGIPYLADGLAFLDCAVHTHIPAGDHHIIVGHVDALGRLRPGRPLLYYESRYSRL